MRYYKSDAVYRDVVFRFYMFGLVASTAVAASYGVTVMWLDAGKWALALTPIVHVIVWVMIANGMVRQFRDLRDYAGTYEKEPPHPTDKEPTEEQIPMKIKGKPVNDITVTR